MSTRLAQNPSPTGGEGFWDHGNRHHDKPRQRTDTRRTVGTDQGRGGERGAGMLTSVLLVPVLFSMILMVLQYGLAAHARTVLAGAVQDGAAAGARLDATPIDGSSLAAALIEDSIPQLLTAHSTTVTVAGDRVVVSAEATVISIIPFIDGVDVAASASSPIEQFSPQGS